MKKYIIDPKYLEVVDENPDNNRYTLTPLVDFNANLVLEGDNLHTLSCLQDRGEFVDMLYIDPPYNTGKNAFRYQDQNTEWASFIYNRLVLARNLMRTSGTIFMSIDDNEYHTLRMVADAVFGAKNFVANFIWKKSHTVKNDKRGISTQHEYILCYAKDIKSVSLNREKTGSDYIDKAYRYLDTVGRYRVVPLHKEKNKKSFAVTSPLGHVWVKNWNYSPESFKELEQKDLLYWGKNGDACPQKKVYLKSEMTKTFGTILSTDVGYTGYGGKALEDLGFSKTEFIYAKPVELISHFIRMATQNDSCVMDFFAGSGTTAHAVMSVNAEDGGYRKFVVCNSNENDICEKITLPRILRAASKLGDQSKIEFSKVISVE